MNTEPQNTGNYAADVIPRELDAIQNIIASIMNDGNETFVNSQVNLNKSAAKRVRAGLLEIQKLCKQYRAEAQERVNGSWFK